MRLVEVHCERGLRHCNHGQKANLSIAGAGVSEVSQLKDQQSSLAAVDVFLDNHFIAYVVGEKMNKIKMFLCPKGVFGREGGTVWLKEL